MPRYLDPKADLIFKKIFGEHPTILISFLNALLPLDETQQIISIEYLPSEQVPAIPTLKNTIVDVKCVDKQGRIFIVEMQMVWSDFFKQRMLFNAGKAYVKQLDKGEDYHLLKPVYGLGLVNEIFDKTDDWYHHYGVVNIKKPHEEVHQIKDLHLIFVELPKFKPLTLTDKKLTALWLRFLSEINDKTTTVPAELLAVREINEALALAEESAYTREELEAYDTYWDRVRTERSLAKGKYQEGRVEGEVIGIEKGKIEGRMEGEAIGFEKGRMEGEFANKQKTAQAMLAAGFNLADTLKITGLTQDQIHSI